MTPGHVTKEWEVPLANPEKQKWVWSMEGQLVSYLFNHFVQFLSTHLLREEFLNSRNA